jgi:Putative peptidoglycan binding domain/D-alanyl-D-alanine carboxypeptidase
LCCKQEKKEKKKQTATETSAMTSRFFLLTLCMLALCGVALAVDYTQLVNLPAGLSNQNGHTYLKQSTVVSHFGAPCAFKTNCQPVSNSKVKALLKTVQVHENFKAYGLGPAVDRLKAALDNLKVDHPDLYGQLGFSGMLCCRAVRGSSKSYSNHAFGMAVDFNVNGKLDPRADGKAQRGLLTLYPYMAEQGFFWAAGYSPAYEDAMHFEISQQTFTTWLADGTLSSSRNDPVETVEQCAWPVYSLARDQNDPATANVYALQRLLNYRGFTTGADGRFGSGTDRQVRAFQNAKALTSDGVVGQRTWTELLGAYSVLRKTSQGPDGRAMAVQELLARTYSRSLGSNGVDGYFGQRSVDGTLYFQGKYYFQKDGEVDLTVFKGMLTRCTGPLTPSRKTSFRQEPETIEENGDPDNAEETANANDGPDDGLILAILLPCVLAATAVLCIGAWVVIRYRHHRSVVPDFISNRWSAAHPASSTSASDPLASSSPDAGGDYALMENVDEP